MYAVVFRAKVLKLDEQYSQMAMRMRDLALSQYGCREFVSALNGDEEIAISYWDSEAQIREWKNNSEHLAAQNLGQNKWYSSYSVQVTKIEREYRSGDT